MKFPRRFLGRLSCQYIEIDSSHRTIVSEMQNPFALISSMKLLNDSSDFIKNCFSFVSSSNTVMCSTFSIFTSSRQVNGDSESKFSLIKANKTKMNKY